MRREQVDYVNCLEDLWDQLSDMVEGGRLTEADLPDDFQALCQTMERAQAALDEVCEAPGHWEDDPDYPVSDWKYEVANDDTRLGYREWVDHQREMNAEDDGGE